MSFIAEQILIIIKIDPSAAIDQSIIIFSPWTGYSVVRAESQYNKFAGSVPSQGTYKNQPINVSISGTTTKKR